MADHLRTTSGDGSFKLYDLFVEVVVPSDRLQELGGIKPTTLLPCNARMGDSFELQGEMLFLPAGQGMSIYSLGGVTLSSNLVEDERCLLTNIISILIASVLPLLAAKQRFTAQSDWMTFDAEVACPDPSCPSRLKITRSRIRTFHRDGSQTVEEYPT